MGSVKSGTRNVPKDVELSREFLYTNYRETIARMLAFGICKEGTAKDMLDRVETLVGEGTA
jgi:hypothetical protein